MQIQNTAKEGLRQEFKVIIPSEEVEEKVVNWLQDRSKTTRLDGFRPGKIPLNILRQRFGGQALQDSIQHFVQKSTQQIYTEHNIKVAGQPTYEIGIVEEGKDFSFSISLESLPFFKLKDFSHIELDKLDVEVSAKEIEEALSRLAANYKKFEPAKETHKISLEDQVKLNLELFEGGNALKNYPPQAVEFALKEVPSDLELLNDVLIGRKKHEKFEIEEKLERDFFDRKLIGKIITFKVEVIEVSSPAKIEINDAFAKEFGCDNLAELRENIQTTLKVEYDKLVRVYYKRHLLDALANQYAFELPNNMVQNEFNNIWQRLEEEMNLAKERGELTPEEQAKPLNSYEDEYKKIAERRVRLGLVVAEVAKENNLHLTVGAINKLIIQEAMLYPGEEKKVVDFYYAHPEMVERLSGRALEDKVIDFILTKVKFKNVNLTYPELRKKLKGILPNYEDNLEEERETSQSSLKTEKKKKKPESEETEEKPKQIKKQASKKSEGKSA